MIEFRPITPADREDYLRLTAEFYATDAVLFRVDTAHFERGFEELLRSDVYMVCHLFFCDGELAGYGLVSKAYSQEAGGMVWWIEELYVLPPFRGEGVGTAYFRFLMDIRPQEVKRFRLEVERENEAAVALYERLGFAFLDYDQMFLKF